MPERYHILEGSVLLKDLPSTGGRSGPAIRYLMELVVRECQRADAADDLREMVREIQDLADAGSPYALAIRAALISLASYAELARENRAHAGRP